MSQVIPFFIHKFANLTRRKQVMMDIMIVLLASFLIVLMGQFVIPLPFTPIPIAFRLQTILFLSVLLGSKRAFLATVVFLMQGLMGFFPFTNGLCGIAGVLGPAGGYLVGYLAAAFIVGYLTERNLASRGVAFLAGTLVTYVLGASYLATFVGVQKAILLGVVPFVLGDLLKTAVVLRLLQRV